MPIPKPRENESKKDFIRRCMSNDTMVDEYDKKKRAAICYNAWDKSNVENSDIDNISKEQIVSIGTDIAREIVKRKKEKEMKFIIDPDSGSKSYQKFWNEVKKNLTEDEIKWLKHTEADIKKNEETDSEYPSFLDEFSDRMVILENIVNLVGSSVNNDDYNDIDICERTKSKKSYLSRAINTRLIKELPDDTARKLHIFSEPQGPHDSYVPLYDLVLVKKDPKIVEMSDSFEPMQSFRPSKTTAETYYKIDELIKELW